MCKDCSFPAVQKCFTFNHNKPGLKLTTKTSLKAMKQS